MCGEVGVVGRPALVVSTVHKAAVTAPKWGLQLKVLDHVEDEERVVCESG